LSKSKNILVVTYWGFNSSILASYTLPYLLIIKKQLGPAGKIFLITLTAKDQVTETELSSTNIRLQEQGIELLNYNYNPFGFRMALRFVYILTSLIYKTLKLRIDVIHGWCTTGGAIAYLLSAFTRKPLVLDSFEPHAESMVETGTWRKDSLAFKILFKLEKLQLKRAVEVICAAEGMIAYSQKVYGLSKRRYFVKPACVDLNLFSKNEINFSLVEGINEHTVLCVYAGKFGDIYLTNEVFDFFSIAANYWGQRFKVLLLTNHSDIEIKNFCEQAQLNPSVVIKKFVPHKEVPAYLSLGSFGICPVRPVPTKKYCTPIKNGEYWAMGLPVVITKDISTDSDLITQQNIGYVLQELTKDEYLNAVKKIDALLIDNTLPEKIRKVAEAHRSYKIAEKIYSIIYA